MDMFQKKEFAQFISKVSERGDNLYLTKNEANQLQVGLIAFMKAPEMHQRKVIAKIMAEGVSTDLPLITKESFNVSLNENNTDMFWELAFQLVPLGTNEDAWEVATNSSSLIVRKVEEGQRIQVDGITGALVTGKVEKYGGAIGWTDEMIRFRKLARMADIARTFRNRSFETKANVHYALLAAAGALPANITAYQGAAADGQLQRDIQTINQAAFNLTNRNKDKSFGDTANMSLLMYANPLLRGRLNAAFNVTTNALAAAGRTGAVVDYNIRTIYTYNASIATRPLLIIPGNKIQRAQAMEPTVFNAPLDVLSLQYCQAVWEYYGALIADTDQVEGLTFS